MVNNNDTITLPRILVEQVIKTLEGTVDFLRDDCPHVWASVTVLHAALDQSNRQSVHESELMMNDASYRRKFEQTQVGQEHGIK